MTVRAVVINIHDHGATVRLEDGTLAAVSKSEFGAHRAAYVAAYDRRATLELSLVAGGRHPGVAFARPNEAGPAPEAPRLTSVAFEERMSDYLRSSQERAGLEGPDAAERHFIRKKRRAALFEARNPPA